MKKEDALDKEFLIPFGGKKLGKHAFVFELDKTFIESRETLHDIDDLSVNATVTLDKQSAMLTFYFDLEGTISVNCDRCGQPLDLPIEIMDKLFVKFGEDQFEITDDVISIGPNETQMQIAPYLFEFLMLAIPMKKTHPDGGCDEAIISQLAEEDVDEDGLDTDPRWEALKKLK